jgi:hypothetical protein
MAKSSAPAKAAAAKKPEAARLVAPVAPEPVATSAPVVEEPPVVIEEHKPANQEGDAAAHAAFKTKIAAAFAALVKAKVGAGLPRKDSAEVARRQVEYDFAGAPDEIKALIKEALDAAVTEAPAAPAA